MPYDPDRHHRRSIRLPGYDYAQAGAYFVTICTQDRACLFGRVMDDEVVLNEAGRMVTRWWIELAHTFPSIAADIHIVMPNHVHGIIAIVGADLCVGPPADAHGGPAPGAHAGAPLHQIVQWFKTMTTNAYIRGVKHQGWPPFSGRLWQRNYYERIMRSEAALNAVR